ncbi:MAG: nucleotide exchange factor GrpE [Ruminococcus sp.]|nr:nucleotide exchange factor GrpE [Ruminococcus sp.]
MSEELRDNPFEEETSAEDTASAAEESDFLEEEAPFSETDDGEPEIVELTPEQQAMQEANDKYMRLFAEFDNYRKRTAKEKTESYQDAVAKTVLELLPVVDNFERAMAVASADEAFKNGMEKIYQQLCETLKKLGVAEIPSMGESFDPKVHNAIRQIEDESFGENIVCEVYQKGYRLGDRIIRHAMVSVANCV